MSGQGYSGYQGYRPVEDVELPAMKVGDTVQRHELVRPFSTALRTGLGFAVAGVVVLVVAFLLVFILIEANSGSSTPAQVGVSCDDGSTPSIQDGGLICDDGSLPR